MFYILHGEEEFLLSEMLAKERAELGQNDPGMAQLNMTVLDGGRVTMGELRHVCETIPFMAQYRLVIVHGLLSRLAPGSRAKGQKASGEEEPVPKGPFLDDLTAYLPKLPDSTRLFFVEDRTLPPSHPILKLAEAESRQKRAKIQHVKKLKDKDHDGDLPQWIRKRAQEKGGRLSVEAITLLAALVGNDLRLLDQEIEKLLVYAGERPVTTEDVRILVSYAREESIFELVDCVGRRETGRALQYLHHLLDDKEEPLYLLAMLARQVRILMQVAELQAQRLTAKEIAERLQLHPYVVQKSVAQARNFDAHQLEQAHQRLVETDWLIKTGSLEEVLALDMLIVNLTRA